MALLHVLDVPLACPACPGFEAPPSLAVFGQRFPPRRYIDIIFHPIYHTKLHSFRNRWYKSEKGRKAEITAHLQHTFNKVVVLATGLGHAHTGGQCRHNAPRSFDIPPCSYEIICPRKFQDSDDRHAGALRMLVCVRSVARTLASPPGRYM